MINEVLSFAFQEPYTAKAKPAMLCVLCLPYMWNRDGLVETEQQ